MAWFDEQIRQRKKKDDEIFEDSFIGIAESVMGRRMSAALSDARKLASDAVDEVLKYYGIPLREIDEDITDINEVLEYRMRPYGIMRRNVILEKGWYKDANGAMLSTRKDDGSVVALIPYGISGYRFFDYRKNAYVRINRHTEDLIDREAIAFYKPFPMKKMSIASFIDFMRSQVAPADLGMVCAATGAATLIGMLLTRLNSTLFSKVIASGNGRVLFGMASFMLCATISAFFVGIIKGIAVARVSVGLGVKVEAASMMRILSLPAGFFRDYNTGELSTRMNYINALSDQIVQMVLSFGLTGVFSLAYVIQIFRYAPGLVVPALCVMIFTVVLSAVTVTYQAHITKQMMELSAKESGVCHSLIGGIQKIRLSGSEQRAFAKWGEAYAKSAALQFNPPLFLKISPVIELAISLVGTMVIYFMAIESGVTSAQYMAFNTAYGMMSGAFFALSGIATTIAQIKPTLDMVKPILETVPEVDENKIMVTSLSGAIEISNVTFGYEEGRPPVLDDLSLKINPGQYVAIVGKTGCGKSTLMRLLLGFETPQSGSISYDGRDVRTLDPKSLRRRIGTVMQDGKLFMGDIFANIVLCAPWLTLDRAWEAAETACIADDIKRMPMGMNTWITEGQGGISGGQKQRIMIARAIAPKPKILMFDEATSALDNIAQKKISEALDKMNCTRIVIAHRLSTIRQCDRIVVLSGGHIVEDGTYDELIAKGGHFADLVARQRLDKQ